MSDAQPEAASPQPHDRFFKYLLAELKQARSFLRGMLPPELLTELQLEGLEFDQASYVDEELQSHLADLVFRCPLKSGGEVQVAVLLEHKSYPPAFPHLQLLRYMLNLWEQTGPPLRPVIPILVYHGRQPWRAPAFDDYFPAALPAHLKAFLPRFDFLLLNLRKESQADLQQRFDEPFLLGGLQMMKYIYEKTFLAQLNDLLNQLTLLPEDELRIRIFRIFIRYARSGGKITFKTMEKSIDELIESWQNAKGTPMHDILLRVEKRSKGEWMEKGMEKGEQKGIALAITKLLAKGYLPAEVSDLLEIPLPQVEAIAQQFNAGD